ncbi:hypothetical protein AV656_08060 [Bhargavaea cecembensis]|uniref:Uncharacterized protein n=1 Tax=Bhargavaea cecembensis TaxID=394098 RepID=A0A163FK66_9BACL|nr:hypothetical protein [Bhargavaea cecembensis]KZE38846.1 hypothetical protein AV656_08060 [Bhargavaea cecembensis]
MINTTYYDGFEGEHQITLINGEDQLIIWDGYFDTIMDVLFDSGIEKEGIVKDYFYLEGWYDEPQPIEDIPLTIRQLKAFDVRKSGRMESLKEVAVELVEDMIKFLERADGEVMIELV